MAHTISRAPAVIEGYGPNGLLNRLTGNGWGVSRKGIRHFKSIAGKGNAVLYDHPSSEYPIKFRVVVDTVPSDPYPVIVEGWQSLRFWHVLSRKGSAVLKLDGISLRNLRYQELDHQVSAYRVTCTIQNSPEHAPAAP